MQLNSNEIKLLQTVLKRKTSDLYKLKDSYITLKEDLGDKCSDRSVVTFAETKLRDLNTELKTVDGLLEKMKDEVS